MFSCVYACHYSWIEVRRHLAGCLLWSSTAYVSGTDFMSDDNPWLWIALPAYPSCQDQTYNLTSLTKDLFILCIHVFSLHVWVISLHVLGMYVFHVCA